MEWLFGRRMTPEEQLKKNQRALNKVIFKWIFFVMLLVFIYMTSVNRKLAFYMLKSIILRITHTTDKQTQTLVPI